MPKSRTGLTVIGGLLLMSVGFLSLEAIERHRLASSSQERVHRAGATEGDKTKRTGRPDAGAERRKLDAEIEESTRLQLEEAAQNPPPTYQLFATGGRLTTGAIEAANLTADQQKSVDQILKENWDKASQSFGERAILDESASNTENKISVYNVRSNEAEAKKMREALEADIEHAVGSEKKEILMKGMGRYDGFGGLGSLDVRLEFDFRSSSPKFKYEYLDPDTGRPERFGEAMIEEFRREFGDSFKIQ